jgi:predicted glycosyltransferase
MDLMPYINLVTPIVVTILGTIIHKAIKTPNDSQRAISLSKIAEGFAAMAVIQNPNAKWPQLLQMIVAQLIVAPNNTTSANREVLTRAASAALAKYVVATDVPGTPGRPDR